MRKTLFIVVLGLTMTSQVAYAAEVHIGFTSAVQTVPLGVLSDQITVQSQDASGNKTNLAETGDWFFTSTSPTGKFYSSNTATESLTQVVAAKGTANKNFYYKDSTAGNFTLSVKLTLRTSLISGSASQNITIGTAVATTSSQSTTATSTAQTATTTQTSASGTSSNATDDTDLSGISAHASPLPTSEDIKVKLQLVADAGRERIGVPHAPLLFSVSATDQANKKVTALDTTWSFGDGTSAHGESIEHAYAYPGDYVVIMNTQKGDLAAVDRTLVHILPSAFAITRVLPGMMNDEVEVTNQGKTEMNLERWSVSNGTQSYVFPTDTIILAGKHVTLPFAVTKIMIPDASSVSLFAPDQKMMSTFVLKTQAPVLALVQPVSIGTSSSPAVPSKFLASIPSRESLLTQLIALQRQIAPRVVAPYIALARAPHKIVTVAKKPIQNVAIAQVAQTVPVATPATSSTIVVTKKQSGFFANLMSLFSK